MSRTWVVVDLMKQKSCRWEESLKAHVLDFAGRVSESSVKNFQLASDETGPSLPHGCPCDSQSPLTPSLCLVVEQMNKLTDGRGYETGDRTILQFGRVGPDRFTMDFTAPLSPVQVRCRWAVSHESD